MSFIVVTDDPEDLPIDDAEIVSVSDYLALDVYRQAKNLRVFNFCASYSYQSQGYYVSLLATAREHKIIPPLANILDLKSPTYLKVRSASLDDLIQKNLKDIKSSSFELSIYFGRNLAKKYDRLCQELYSSFRAPLLRAKFIKTDTWHLSSIRPIGIKEVSANHREDFLEIARTFFHKRIHRCEIKSPKFSLAILIDPDEKLPPSNEKAIQLFQKAARKLRIDSELITKADIGRLSEFDGLFIRVTTAVNHYTYRFAQKASALGLVVIDDPESILRCTNKVYLEELFLKHELPTPPSTIVHKTNYESRIEGMKLPAVLKVPDSAFSLGVTKVQTPEELQKNVKRILEHSDLMIVQEFLPTSFDWRVGILAGKIIYVCKYFMANDHWQIYKQPQGTDEKIQDGDAETLSLEEVPAKLKKMALKAAKAVGDGLYGIDIKQLGERFLMIEINDNPSIDAGVEDSIAGDKLYESIMQEFLDRRQKTYAE